MARSRSVWGPFEPCPHNPVLRPPSREEYIQTIGHSDFVEDSRGNWWAVALGTRIESDSASPMGRETYLIQGDWPRDGWPSLKQPVKIFEHSDKLPPLRPELSRKAIFAGGRDVSKDLFTASGAGSQVFALHWIHVRNPISKNYHISSPSSLMLTPSSSTLDAKVDSPTFVGRRQTSLQFEASVIFDIPSSSGVEAGFTVFLDAIRHAEIFISDRKIYFRRTTMGCKGVEANVSPLKRAEPLVEVFGGEPMDAGLSKVKLTVKTSRANSINEFVFSCGSASGGVDEIGRVKALELSVGFTGTIVGMYATGQNEETNSVKFADFEYTELPDPHHTLSNGHANGVNGVSH